MLSKKITLNEAYRQIESLFFQRGYRALKLLDDLKEFVVKNHPTLRGSDILPEEVYKRFIKVVTLLEKDYPVEYITKKTYFMHLTLTIEEPVYIPNPFTERLVQKAYEIARSTKDQISIIDIGTGTGAVILALATLLKNPSHEYIATDIDDKAVQIARKNAKRIAPYVKIVWADVAFINSEVITPRFKKVLLLTNKPYLPNQIEAQLDWSVRYQSPLALYKNNSFEKKLKRYIKLLVKSGKEVTLVMETLRTRHPPTAKIVTYRFTSKNSARSTRRTSKVRS